MKDNEDIKIIESIVKDLNSSKEIAGSFNQENCVVEVNVREIDSELFQLKADNHVGIRRCSEKSGYEKKQYLYFIGPQNTVHEYETWVKDQKTVSEYLFSINAVSESQFSISFNDVSAIILSESIIDLKISEDSFEIQKTVTKVSKTITVYLPPKKGLKSLIQENYMLNNVKINEAQLNIGLENNQRVYKLIEVRLNNLIHDFGYGVYVRGFQDHVESFQRGSLQGSLEFIDSRVNIALQGKVGYIKTTYRVSGRNQFELSLSHEDAQTQITFVGIPCKENPEMKILSFSGKLPAIEGLVEDFIKYWKAIDVPYNVILN